MSARRASRASRDEAGLTLIEVVIAVLVITIGVLALAAVIPTGIHRVTDSEAQTRASALGSERVEQLLITPYDHEDLDAGSHHDPENPRDGLYDVDWSVELEQPVEDCKRVTVTVRRASTSASLGQLVIVVPRSGG